MSREIVTLQLGHYSNFVGTHWWNIQESSFVYSPTAVNLKEIDHDVLFREGQTLHGDVTFTPRLIAVDLKGSLNALKSSGVLYDVKPDQENLHWNSDVTLHTADTGRVKNDFLQDLEKQEARFSSDSPKNVNQTVEEDKDGGISKKASKHEEVLRSKLYDLDDTVSVWSDYLKIHLHPRSVLLVEEYKHDSDVPFDVYGCGQQIYSNSKAFQAEYENRLHYFTEECDQLQGFHLLFDQCDGFSGIASSVLQDIADEYPNKSILSLPLSPVFHDNNTAQGRTTRIMNAMLGMNAFWDSSSLIVPMSLAVNPWKKHVTHREFNNVTYKAGLNYHTSAIVAAGLDTASLPWRQTKVRMNLVDVTSNLNVLGRKMASVEMYFPYPLQHHGSLYDILKTDLPWTSLSPTYTDDTRVTSYLQSVVLRGIPSSNTSSQITSQELILKYYTEKCKNTQTMVHTFQAPCKTSAPYPHIFNKNIDSNGLIIDKERASLQGVEQVPIMTSLNSSKETANILDNIHKEADRVDIKKMHRFTEAGLEVDDWTECIHNVAGFVLNYSDS